MNDEFFTILRTVIYRIRPNLDPEVMRRIEAGVRAKLGGKRVYVPHSTVPRRRVKSDEKTPDSS